ncbi:hypothetical protein GCM10010412_088450 [Nonomuraea recticatena]|uniref:Uncharacterized protein n=1 Tax=Nonomuraea recticatena TaxID=46178 RepID=A0ABN3T9K0_9ACTN
MCGLRGQCLLHLTGVLRDRHANVEPGATADPESGVTRLTLVHEKPYYSGCEDGVVLLRVAVC